MGLKTSTLSPHPTPAALRPNQSGNLQNALIDWSNKDYCRHIRTHQRLS